jgi:hypothetical protein
MHYALINRVSMQGVTVGASFSLVAVDGIYEGSDVREVCNFSQLPGTVI